MKLQYLAVIFIIIILPISLVLSQYVNVQIDTISKQTRYSKMLADATYDTIKSFQLNTVNNRYSSVATSKLRDLNAASNTFFNTLGTTLQMSREDLEQHVPAIVYTLYDGYYIYTKSNTQHITENVDEFGNITQGTPEDITEFSLKPYVYYSKEYTSGNKKVIINYTLDNFITVFYYNPDALTLADKYTVRSGYFIDTSAIELVNGVNYEDQDHYNMFNLRINYDNMQITGEHVKENLLFEDDQSGEYEYIKYNNKKVYYDSSTEEFFWYDNYKKTPIYDSNVLTYARNRLGAENLYSRSAVDYYYQSYVFSEWLRTNFSWIEDDDGNSVFSCEFPERKGSVFDEHRMEVIRQSITTNLIKAIANYNSYAMSYEYELPRISETDWYRMLNEVSIVTFLQGMPLGSKYFNDYCVINNNKTEEMIHKESLYFNLNGEYHKIGCKFLVENSANIQSYVYFNLNYERQEIKKNTGESVYFYPKQETGCYHCTVKSESYYTADDIINGNDIVIDGVTYTTKAEDTNNYSKLRVYYCMALAREKYDLYKSNNF